MGKLRTQIENAYYAVKPLRFLILTEALLLYLIFAMPQGKEILRISLEQYEYNPAGPLTKLLALAMIAAALVLATGLTGPVFYRTLEFYRDKDNDKQFDDDKFDRVTIKRFEQAITYTLLAIPFALYFIHWTQQRLSDTWAVALLQILIILAITWAARRDDRIIRDNDGAMDKTLLHRLTYSSFRYLSWLIWSIPLFLLLGPSFTTFIQWMGPLAILLLASYVILNIVYAVNWMRIKWKIPSFPIVILWVVLCSHFNQNHWIPFVKNSQPISARPALSAWVGTWLEARADTAGAPIPVYIVAAEGGGSRAAYWTCAVLQQLEAELAFFPDNLLGVSSVSGGTVGAGFYLANRQLRNEGHGPLSDSLLLEAVGHDLLSPLLSGFFFSDLAQQFLPVPIGLWDRSRRLEHAMINAFAAEGVDATANPLSRPSMAGTGDLPLHLINSTIVESGTKGVWSAVRLDDEKFAEATDLAAWLGRDVGRAMTLVNSARFPLVTPGGEMRDTNRYTLGHIVDGGYFENTGIETAYALLRCLDDYRDSLNIEPVFIYIQNSREDEFFKPASSTLTASNPLRVFYNAWSSRSPSNHALVDGLQRPLDFTSVHIPLVHGRRGVPYKFPLAWVLSKKSRDAMQAQADTLWQRPGLKGVLGALPGGGNGN
jgi:hypothetical protein